MPSVFIRIALRYIAAFLVTKGMLSAEVGDMVSADPDFVAGIEIILGALIGVAAEVWYYASNRFGWSK